MFHRVISDPDDVGKNNNNNNNNNNIERSTMDPMDVDQGEKVEEQQHNGGSAGGTFLAEQKIDIIEPENIIIQNSSAPVPVIERVRSNSINSNNSSLSGDDDDDPEDEQLVKIPGAKTRNLSRMNSRGSSSSSQRAPSSQTSSRDWGWFEDVHLTENSIGYTTGKKLKGNIRNHHNDHHKKSSTNNESKSQDGETSAMAVTAPTYVLEESLSSQRLWKQSAGTRPPQPVEERAFYEKMWLQNFARSQVDYRMPVEVLTATSPISLDPFADNNFDSSEGNYAVVPAPPRGGKSNNTGNNNDAVEAALVSRMIEGPYNNTNVNNYHNALSTVKKQVQDPTGEGNLTVLVRGDNVFGTTVSKSFARSKEQGDPITGVDTINISIASYRVVESKKHGKYAQFLVIYREGSIRNTIGIWKRYSDFEELANKVTQAHDGCAAAFANISPLYTVAEESNNNGNGSDESGYNEPPETEHLPNAITSWRLLKKRKRWYRCLDAGYLSLKVFLLERFLHDILFESSSPQLLRDFVGVDSLE